uniref:Uncharacterized protein n=1 Tax=Arundo donax TaxID=35708 RepID=A0A0A8Y6K0_ARUDO
MSTYISKEDKRIRGRTKTQNACMC